MVFVDANDLFAAFSLTCKNTRCDGIVKIFLTLNVEPRQSVDWSGARDGGKLIIPVAAEVREAARGCGGHDLYHIICFIIRITSR